MPYRKNKNGKLEYYRENSIYKDNKWGFWDILGDDEHSCSPEECPTCKDKSCPNYKYEDLIEKGEFEL